MLSPNDIPAGFPVQTVHPGAHGVERPATCGTCGLSWDDAVVTSMTPAPSGRCPFEAFHKPEPEQQRTDAPLATPEQIAAARELHPNERSGNDSLAIDDNATVSDAMPAGYWVSAWVWVPGSDDEGETEEQLRRQELAAAIRRKGNGHRSPVALYRKADDAEPAAVGIVQAIETEGVRIAGSFAPWSGIARVERWTR